MKGGTYKARVQEVLNSDASFKIPLPLYSKATMSDCPQTSFFTPRHIQVERRELFHLFGISRSQTVQKSSIWPPDIPGSPE